MSHAIAVVLLVACAVTVLWTGPAWSLIRFIAGCCITAAIRLLELIGGARVKWYTLRDDATPDMIRDFYKYSRLVFIGISQRSLSDYLHRSLSSGATPFPWKEVEVYFAGDILGHGWEGEIYQANLKKNRQQIAYELTAPHWRERLPNIERVCFKQYNAFLGYGGSMFGDESGFGAIYVVQSFPQRKGDTKKSLTMKLDIRSWGWADRYASLFQHYIDGYKALSHDARSLGVVTTSMWDDSAVEWSNFCEESNTLLRSMQHLIEFSEIRQDESVLDVGSGTGETTKCLLKAVPNGTMTVLDKSPQMLRKATHTLGNAGNVKYALCALPSLEREDIDIEGERFNCIVVHMSLTNIASTLEKLKSFARWCKKHIHTSGRVIIAAHDGAVKLPRNQRFDSWCDPFRPELERHLKAAEFSHSRVSSPVLLLSQDDLKQSFVEAGFKLGKHHIAYFPFTMEDRRLMWKVPAIINTVVDVHKVGKDRCSKLIEEVFGAVVDRECMDRSVGYWRFDNDATI